jgi:hypothetical protein
MIITLIITAIVGAVFMHNYFKVKDELESERELHLIRYNATKDWKFKHDKLESLYQECWELLTERSEEVIKYKLVIESRDLKIIELEKINLEYFKSIHQNCIKILAQEEEIENLKKYSKGMRKLNKDMIKKYVALNNELEQLTKTAPFGKGNK